LKEVINETHLYYISKRATNLRIAICDDYPYFRKNLVSIFTAYKNESLHCIDIHEYSCGEDLLDSDIYYDIIFLDYMMTGLNGFDTAKKLRTNGIESKIIFITNYTHFVYDAFEVRTFRFYEKPVNPEQLYKALDDYVRKYVQYQ